MDKLEQELWKTQYVEKYKEIPTDLKYAFIEKDYRNIFGGKKEAESRMRYLYDDSETFIFTFDNALAEFTSRVRKGILKKYLETVALDEYYKLQDMGFFFEFFPNLSGEWLRDKEFFTKFVTEREMNKEYVKLILEK
jgi:hypothetical protein